MKLTEADETEKQARDILGHEAWGERLSVAQFVEREKRLRAHAWPRATLRTWLLTDDAGVTLASCEAYRMDCTVDGVDGSVYGVASVLTEPKFRGRGYATSLMRLLLERVREEDPRAHGSVLFSDVGAALYQHAGYVTRPGWDRVIPVTSAQGGRTELSGGVELFVEGEVAAELARVEKPRDERVLVWPSAHQLDWHLERARAYEALLGVEALPACGARHQGGRIFWSADRKNERLVILLLQAADPHVGRALVAAAVETARAAGLREVRHWDTPLGFPDDDLGGTREVRPGGLPMITVFGEAERGDDWSFIPRAIWV